MCLGAKIERLADALRAIWCQRDGENDGEFDIAIEALLSAFGHQDILITFRNLFHTYDASAFVARAAFLDATRHLVALMSTADEILENVIADVECIGAMTILTLVNDDEEISARTEKVRLFNAISATLRSVECACGPRPQYRPSFARTPPAPPVPAI